MKMQVRLLAVACMLGGLVFITRAYAQAAPDAAAPAQTAPVAVAPAQTASAETTVSIPLSRLPQRLSYREGDSIPEGYFVSQAPLRGLMVAGIVTLGVPYVTAVVVGAIYSATGGNGLLLVIPIAGPFLLAGASPGLAPILLIDGGIQVAGLAMGILGAVLTRPELVRADLATLSIVPVHMGRGGYGIAAVGTF